MLREIRDLGFEYAELSHGIRVSLVPGILEAVDAGEIRISTLHNFCPLPIGINHAAPNIFKFSSPDRRERDSAWKHSMKTLEMAERVKAKLIVLHTGEVPLKDYNDKLESMVAAGQRDTPKYRKLVEEMERKREAAKEIPMQLAFEFITLLSEQAASRGLLLGIENREAVEEIPFDYELDHFVGQLPQNVARYWHDCGHAQIKHHLGLLEHRMHLENLAPMLGGFHVHDVVASPEDGLRDHCPPGVGEVPFEQLKPFVKPEHIKTLELNPGIAAEDVVKGYEFIRSVWGPE
ncbi:MAG TPA: TIM barrel protein [Candidatus Limnocylindria bacterium]|jgi:sugar phosphate isomerase/epimerase|nr:TIM barrel protein [Candidatus Limnocylindria bacterium]